MQQKNNLFIAIFLLLICAPGWSVFSQEETTKVTKQQLAALIELEEQAAIWAEKQETPGVQIEGEMMKFSEEAQRLIKDEAYRASCYNPSGYTFRDVQVSIAANEVQKAFWQMINLYPEHKEDVLKYIYAYDKVLSTDKVVTAAFYTYGFFDPQITRIENGKPDVYRPDLFEGHLRNTREIVSYILFFRKQEVEK